MAILNEAVPVEIDRAKFRGIMWVLYPGMGTDVF